MSKIKNPVITREEIIIATRRWIGTPYLHQASQCQVGCDCLGLLRGIWRELIDEEPQEIPNYSADWGECGQREHLLCAAHKHLTEIPAEQSSAGDILLFRWAEKSIAKHVGIKMHGGRFIHAYEKTGVIESSLTRDWTRKIAGYFAFPGLES